jgi:hypothetical protein
VQSSSVDIAKGSNGALQEGTKSLEIMIRIAWLEIGSSFGSIAEEDERV